MRVAPLVLALGLTACSFDDQIPDSLVVRCSANEECPRGLICSVISQHCQLRNSDDTLAPTLSGALSRTRTQPGAEVTLTVTADEVLRGQPLVEVRTAGMSSLLEAQADGTYRFASAVDEPDGAISFFGTAEDLAGNGTRGVLLGTLIIDGTPPTLEVARISPPRAAPGAPIAVTATFDEVVSAGSGLIVQLADGGLITAVSATEGDRVATFNFTIPTGTPSGPLPLAVQHAIDLVGNELVSAAAGSVVVDADPPLVTSLVLNRHRFSAQPGFDLIVVDTTATGADRLDVCLDQACQSSMGHAEFAVLASAGDGPHLVSVRVFDDVGNQALASEIVLFDFKAPEIIASGLSYRAPPTCPFSRVTRLGAGGLVDLALTVDEPLARPPVVTASSMVFSTQSRPGLSWFFTGQPQALVDGSQPIAVTLEDDVGNVAVRGVADEFGAPAAVQIDTIPPDALDAAHKTGFIYRRVPYGATSTSYLPRFTIQAGAGSFTASTRVLVLDRADPNSAITVASVTVDANGAIQPFALQPVDAAELYFLQFDEACNADATATRVPSVEYVLSLEGRAEGRNPHRFVDVYRASLSARDGETHDWGTEVARADGRFASIHGPSMRWFSQASATPSLGAGGTCALSDPRSGDLVVFGSDLNFQPAHFIKRSGRWLRDAVSPNAAPSARCFFDDARQTYLTYRGGFASMWDGTNWNNVGTRALGAPNNLAYGQGALWALQPGGRVQKWDGAWTVVLDAGVLPPSVPVWSHSRNQLVAIGRDPLAAYDSSYWFDGSTWTDRENELGSPSFSNWLSAAAASNPNDSTMLLVTRDTSGGVHTSTLLDPQMGFWEIVGSNPSFMPRALFPEALDAGFIAVAGSPTLAVERFQPATVTWTADPDFTDPFSYLPQMTTEEGSLMTDVAGGTVLWSTINRATLTTDDGGVDGGGVDGGGQSALAYSWRFDGRRWENPVPNATTHFNMVGTTEPDSGRPIQLGMFSLLWDGAAWQPLSPTSVVERPNWAVASDTNRKVMVTFGGGAPGGLYSDTCVWQWVATGSIMTSCSFIMGTQPSGRAAAAMAFDESRNRVVLFGGQLTATGYSAETFEFDTSTRTWFPITTPTSPPARAMASMVWDPIRRVLVLHGGESATGTLTDTWMYDGKAWVDVTAQTGAISGAGKGAWDPQAQAILWNSDTGPSWLMPQPIPVAQRLLPDLSAMRVPAVGRFTGGELNVLSNVASGFVACQLWDQGQWKSIGTCQNSMALTAGQLDGLFDAGVQLMAMELRPDGGTAPNVSPVTLNTDAVELTVRYSLP